MVNCASAQHTFCSQTQGPTLSFQAPISGLSKEQKPEMILTRFRDSRTCHPLKDLEALLAKAASINKMQVKDFLKELTDENEARAEKIGSVNWYWCWAGEEGRRREDVVHSWSGVSGSGSSYIQAF
jgi:hypothetical protein